MCPRRLTAPAFAHRGTALTPLRPAFTPELRRLVARSPGAGMVFYACGECHAYAARARMTSGATDANIVPPRDVP